jgi:ribosomal protein S8E
MKTYLDINLPFKRKFILQKDGKDSYTIKFYKEKRKVNTSIYLDSMERPFLSKDTNDTKALIQQIAFNEKNSVLLNIPVITKKEVVETEVTYNDIYKTISDIAATTPAEDISTPIYTDKSMSEEEKEYYRGVVRKAEKEIEAGKIELEAIINKNKQTA